MALLRLRNAAAAALPRLHNGAYLSHFAPCELSSPAHHQGFSLSFSKNTSRGCSLPAARRSQLPGGVFAAAAEVAVCCDCSISGNVFASIAAIQMRHSTAFTSPSSLLRNCLSASNGPVLSVSAGVVGTSLFSSSLLLSNEAHVNSRWFSTARSILASRTALKMKKRPALICPVTSSLATNSLQKRSTCSSAVDPSSSIDSASHSVLPRASCRTQLNPSSCTTRGFTAGIVSSLALSGSCETANAAESAALLGHTHAFRFLPLRDCLSGGTGGLCRRCGLFGFPPAASSLVLLSHSMPPSVALGPTAAAAFASLSAAVPLPLRTAAGAAAGVSFSSTFPAAFSAAAPLVGCPSSLPASPVLPWEAKSKRFLGARTRRQREEVERKAEQQRNSQLTAAQDSLHTTTQSSQHPRAYNSYYQQVPPAGAAAGLSLGWQITIAFISSIAFYFGFVMMMRLFGGHRVVAVHVDQYGRPVDPLTGQPRY